MVKGQGRRVMYKNAAVQNFMNSGGICVSQTHYLVEADFRRNMNLPG